MKQLFWNIGKAAFAVVVFVYLQGVLSAAVTVGFTLVDPSALPQVLLDRVFGYINEISLVSGVLTVLVLWLVWGLQGRSLWKQTNLHRARVIPVALSALLGFGVCLLVTIAMALIPWPEAWMKTYAEMAGEVASGWSVIGVLATVIVAPVVEELVFRGVAYTSLRNVMPRWLAAVLVSAAFGLMHGAVIWFCYTFVLSFAMIFVYEKVKSLWAPIALHMAFNLLGQMPLMGENPSFVGVTFVAAGGVALTAVSGILLVATQEEQQEGWMNE